MPTTPTPGTPCAYVGPDDDAPPDGRLWLFDYTAPGEADGDPVQVHLRSLGGIGLLLPAVMFTERWAALEPGSRWRCKAGAGQPDVTICVELCHHHRGAICVNNVGAERTMHQAFDLAAFTTRWEPAT